MNSSDRRNQNSIAVPDRDFRRLFESVPGRFLVLTPDLRIVAASDGYLRATMTRREEIVGRGMFEIFPDNPEDPQAMSVVNLNASFQRVLRNRAPDTMPVQKYDIRKPVSEGGGFEERYWTPVNSPVFEEDGEIAYIIHRVEDVTDFVRQQRERQQERQAAEKLRQRNVEIEAEVYTRSREVAEANHRLRQAHEELRALYEKAREVDELKTRFFANLSHELRTPLALILGPVEKRLQAELPDAERRELEIVRHNARLLLTHVTNLLDMAKLEAGEMRLRYAEDDLARLVRLSAYAFESVAQEKKIRFRVETPERLPAQIDAEKVARIVLNLLSNAIKFTPDGGEIAVLLRKEDGRGVLRVRDSGPGIPTAMRETIFERFLRLEEGASAPGTGLGLAIVKEFAALHGGDVGVEEAPGDGALFRVELPLYAPEGVEVHAKSPVFDETTALLEAEVVVPTTLPAAAESAPADAPLVLLVEDNPEMRAFLAGTLRRSYRVLTAFDGKEGLEKAMEILPDVIVSDVMMPRMSGDEMAEALRQHPETQDIPIILATARADEDFRVKMLEKGIQGYFTKPFAAEELMARVGGVLAERRRQILLLRESEERFRTLANAIPQLAWIAWPDGHFTWVNERWYEYTGATWEQTEGCGWQNVLDPGILPQMLERWQRAARSGEPLTMESPLRGRDGNYRPFLTRISPLRDADNKVVQWFGTNTDISELKQAQEELKASNRELERRVATRTRELAEANRELEAFNYSVAHDLRTPLTVISGYLELTGQQCVMDGGCRQYLQNAYEGTIRMGQLIDGLLEFARVSREEPKREEIDLGAMAQEIIRELQVAEPERRVTLRITEDGVAHGDPRLLRVVLANLLGNAWKYTRSRDEAQIEFGAERQEVEKIFFVRDNGIGFTQGDAEKLFVPFQRLDGAAEFRGHGIGLATTARIIERHGGRIWAEGEPEKGAAFYFTLPY